MWPRAPALRTWKIIYPPVSILAEPSVAWVDANVTRHERYLMPRLAFLFSDQAQDTIAEYAYPPIKRESFETFAGPFVF
jgi:sulfate/thiosulfate transport system substrate-binding protein